MDSYIIEGFSAAVGKTCALAALKNIMRFNKCSYTENELFFLCNDLNIEYSTDLNDIGSKAIINFPNLEAETQIKVNLVESYFNSDRAKEALEILSQNYPLLLWTSTEQLTYNRVYKENPGRYHAINLYGVDVRKGLAYIADGNIKDYTGQILLYQGQAPLTEIIGATYMYGWFDCKNDKRLSKRRILETARRNFHEFLKGGISDDNISCGYTALQKYVEDFKNLASLDNDSFLEVCININYNLKICSIIHINSYMIGFLKENCLGLKKDCEGLCERMDKIGEEWERLGLLILKLGIKQDREGVGSVREKCNRLLLLQKEIYHEYLQLLEEMVLLA